MWCLWYKLSARGSFSHSKGSNSACLLSSPVPASENCCGPLCSVASYVCTMDRLGNCSDLAFLLRSKLRMYNRQSGDTEFSSYDTKTENNCWIIGTTPSSCGWYSWHSSPLLHSYVCVCVCVCVCVATDTGHTLTLLATDTGHTLTLLATDTGQTLTLVATHWPWWPQTYWPCWPAWLPVSSPVLLSAAGPPPAASVWCPARAPPSHVRRARPLSEKSRAGN